MSEVIGADRPAQRRPGTAARSSAGLWLIALGLTLALGLLAVRLTVLSYMTNDDVFFLQAIARVPAEGIAAVTNTLAHSAQENGESMSILLCMVLGQLYRLDPDGFWYLGHHFVILGASLTVIGRCILGKTVRRGWPLWIGCVLHVLTCAGLFLYTSVVLAFTVTAAVAGCASVALVLSRGDARTRAGRVWTDVGSVLLLVLCWLERKATGICLLCFWCLAAAYQLGRLFLRRRETGRGPVLTFAGVTAGALALVLVLSYVGGHISDPGYREAEHYRSLVLDDILRELPYEDYASLGIPEELATLMHGWFFMDERVTTETFKALTEIYERKQAASPEPLVPKLARLFRSLAGFIREDGQMSCRFWAGTALLLGCAAAFVRRGRRWWPEFFTALFAFGGAGLLMLRLVSGGRFLTRVFLVAALPALAVMLLMLLTGPDGDAAETAPASRGRAADAALLLCAAGFAAACAVGFFRIPTLTENVTREEFYADQRDIEAELAAHGDLFYITSIYDQIRDPLVLVSAYAENVALWGACGDTYRTEGRLYADAFFREDVRFLTDRAATAVALLQYLSLEHGPVQAAVTWQNARGYLACAVEPVGPRGDYTGWYEQNGRTYYFENGRAVTGVRVIDGETYEFAPAGAASSFFAAPGPDVTVYSTYAYSLLS